jgi:hypothetical protein
MKATKETMDVIFVINNGLIDMKLKLLEAEKLAVTTEEKIDIIAVRKKVQEGIKEILHNFFASDMDKRKWLENVTVDNLAKLRGCSHDCKDCDSREVVVDDEHCLQGEEMR